MPKKSQKDRIVWNPEIVEIAPCSISEKTEKEATKVKNLAIFPGKMSKNTGNQGILERHCPSGSGFIASVEGKVCSLCRRKKEIGHFYTKGERTDARCKQCAKNVRKKRYRKEKKDFARYRANRITKVVMKRNEDIDAGQFKQDLQIAKSILGQLFVKVMSKGEEQCQ